ncbi:uncharacterized protein LOC142354863, partial [Convolutriloba macropyga]|uniref:uncharacterized protein LOC142354863 n=1 Tax=Convolutriloba macropyga TaxID=536237 RepID=UPI003F527212
MTIQCSKSKHETRRASFPRDHISAQISLLSYSYPNSETASDSQFSNLPKLNLNFTDKEVFRTKSDEYDCATSPYRRYSECVAQPELIRVLLASQSCQTSLRRAANVCLTNSRIGQEPFGTNSEGRSTAESSATTLTLDGATTDGSSVDFMSSPKPSGSEQRDKSSSEKVLILSEESEIAKSELDSTGKLELESLSQQLPRRKDAKPPLTVTFSSHLAFNNSDNNNSDNSVTVENVPECSNENSSKIGVSLLSAEPAISGVPVCIGGSGSSPVAKAKLDLPQLGIGAYQVTVNAKIRRASTDRQVYSRPKQLGLTGYKWLMTWLCYLKSQHHFLMLKIESRKKTSVYETSSEYIDQKLINLGNLWLLIRTNKPERTSYSKNPSQRDQEQLMNLCYTLSYKIERCWYQMNQAR